jgi:predicted DNA-binding protein
MKEKKEPTVRQVIFTLPVELHDRLAHLAAIDDRTNGLLARRFVMQGIKTMEAQLGIKHIQTVETDQQSAA